MKRRPNAAAPAPVDYKALFDFAPDAILVVDAAGRIRLNNAEAEHLLEAAPGELQAAGRTIDPDSVAARSRTLA